MMPYFLRHYSTFADRIFVYDDCSTDGTRDLVLACPSAILIDYPHSRGLHEEDLLETFGRYRRSLGVADWCMCVDVDEFIHHPNVRTALARADRLGYSVLRSHGYNMVSDHVPATQGQIYSELRLGATSNNYSKCVVLKPSVDIVWRKGRHGVISTTGIFGRVGLKLLHYYYLSPDYHLARKTRNLSRIQTDPFTTMNERGFETVSGYRLRRAKAYYEKLLRVAKEVV